LLLSGAAGAVAREELTAWASPEVARQVAPVGDDFCPDCRVDFPRYPGSHPRAGQVLSRVCKRRTCSSHAPTYLRDRGHCLVAGLEQWTRSCAMVTLTAPGRDRFPFEPQHCRVQGRHRCSGKLGCRVNAWDAAHWNAPMLKNWTALRNECQQVVSRAGLPSPVVLGFVVEVHKRGLFHLHVIVGWDPTPEGRAGYDRFVDELASRCERHDFGPNLDRGKPNRFVAADAARYAAKYVRPQEAKGSFIPTLIHVESVTPRNPNTGRLASVVRPVFVNPKLSKLSGVTMRYLRWRRYAFVVWGRRPLPPEDELRLIYAAWCLFPGSDLVELDPVRGHPVAEAWPF
jgi:hypothetical protein